MGKSAAERMREYRARNRERLREAERERNRLRAEAGPRTDDPEHKKAWNLVAAAVRYGKMVRQPCAVCGEEPAQAHHDDYSKPLEVRWLCREHHLEHHLQTNAGESDPPRLFELP